MENIDRFVRRDYKRAQKDELKDRVQSDMQMATEVDKAVFNINTGYLLSILRLMDEFTIVKVNGIRGEGKLNSEYYYQMWELLEMIADMISPKITKEDRAEIDKRLDDVLNRIDNIFEVTQRGVFVKKREALTLRSDIGKLFRYILQSVERIGMLTYKAEDPSKAMGNFMD
jgi:hypothetical protein